MNTDPALKLLKKRTIGSTGSCLISETSAIDVSVSAPLWRDERVGAILKRENRKSQGGRELTRRLRF